MPGNITRLLCLSIKRTKANPERVRDNIMTSTERRQRRYMRRKARRLERKRRLYAAVDDYNKVFSYKNLYSAYRKARRGTTWKCSVQKFSVLAPLNIEALYEKLHAGKYRSPGFREFDVRERGKLRHIKSTVISERVVQRCLCDNALVPVMSRSFIYDNGASMKNKGYSFAIKRITAKLQKHYRKHGNNGYVLLYDFSKFFDRISHELIKRIINKQFVDARIKQLIYHFVDMFGNIGLGLGSQISQVLALASANGLDHCIKEILHIKDYMRYMDDGALFDISKERLKHCLDVIRELCKKLKITLNEKKTQIVKISHGFTWLKVHFFLTANGKIIRKIYRRRVTKERQLLKKLFARVATGDMPFGTVRASFESWAAGVKKFHAWHALNNMTLLFNDLVRKYKNEGVKGLCCISKSQRKMAQC